MNNKSFSGELSFLSNFYPARIELDGLIYPSVEHAYQAAKTTDLKSRVQIQEAGSPNLAKKLGRNLKIRTDWDDIKLETMKDLLIKKFAESALAKKLLETKGEIVETNWWGDEFWGVCKGKGLNHLGKILMDVRDLLTSKGHGSSKNIIHYLKGDATQPIGNDTKIIAHVVNTSGGWGKGFVLAMSNRWSEPERKYRAWYKSGVRFALGEVLFVKVSDDIIVANLLAQEGYSTSTKPAIRYDALKLCLGKVANKAMKLSATVHCPRLGCGLAGGMWSEVEPIIVETMSGIEIFVYDL